MKQDFDTGPVRPDSDGSKHEWKIIMDRRHFLDGGGSVPSLLSLAVFAVVFFAAIAALEFGAGLVDPMRAALAELPASVKAGALAAFILGTMAVMRIVHLLGGGDSQGREQ